MTAIDDIARHGHGVDDEDTSGHLPRHAALDPRDGCPDCRWEECRCPNLAARLLYTGSGDEEVRFHNGSRILFGARERGFGRGIPGVDILVFDEAQILLRDLANPMPCRRCDNAPESNRTCAACLGEIAAAERDADARTVLTSLRGMFDPMTGRYGRGGGW